MLQKVNCKNHSSVWSLRFFVLSKQLCQTIWACPCWYKAWDMRQRAQIRGRQPSCLLMCKREIVGCTICMLWVCVCVSVHHARMNDGVWSSSWRKHTDCSIAQGDTEMEKDSLCSRLMPIWWSLHLARMFKLPCGCHVLRSTWSLFTWAALCVPLFSASSGWQTYTTSFHKGCFRGAFWNWTPSH